jgi:hypothetical protein
MWEIVDGPVLGLPGFLHTLHLTCSTGLCAIHVLSSLTTCRHQKLAAVSPHSGPVKNAWVYICPQTTKSMHQLIGCTYPTGVGNEH